MIMENYKTRHINYNYDNERENDSCTFEKNDPHNSGALYHLVAT